MKLTGCRSVLGSVRHAVNDETAAPTDPFATVVLERDRLFTALGELLIDDIEHLEERCVVADVLGLVPNEAALDGRTCLSPNVEYEIHHL
jgi:hypothetical protein